MWSNRISNVLRRLRNDERGSIAIIFGFSVFILCGFIGLAVDGARAYSVAARTQASLDTASLAAAKMLDVDGATNDEVKKKATDFYQANLAGNKDVSARFENLVITPMRGNQSVAVQVDVVVPTLFAGIVGLNEFRFKRESMVIYKTRGVELAMVLDITGSMNDNTMTGVATRKIDAMKTAAKAAIATMLDTSAGSINTNRIALAPFSASVNVGSFRASVADSTSFANDTCVIERPGATATNDDPISLGTRARVMHTLGWVPGSSTGARYSCPAGKIQPLTNDKKLLNGQIDAYLPDGGTAGHIGMAWGWNLISPNFDTLFTGKSTPAAYNDTTTIKAVVIMTDGVFNTAYKSGDISDPDLQKAQSNSDFASLCTNMKAKGVIVYTVAFGLDGEADVVARGKAKQTLTDCASTVGNFFDTDSDAELTAAFAEIALQLSKLHISG
jgi:Flp pilus assembly protein TadG